MNPTLVVWLLSGCCLVLGCCQQFILGVPGLVAQDCGVTLSDVGLLNAVFGVANGIGTPVALVFLARFSQKRQLLLGLAVMFAGMVATAASSSFAVLMGVRTFMGVGHGVFVALAYTVAQGVAPRGREGAYMANIALGFGLSQVVAIPLARVACELVSWHVLYGALAAVALAAALLIARLVPRGPAGGAGATGPRQMVAPFSDKAVRTVVVATVLAQLGYNGLYTYITPYMEAGLEGRPAAFVSAVLLVVGLMSMVGTKGSGYVADRIGTRPTFLGGVALAFACYVALVVSWGNHVATVVFACIWIIATWSYVPLQNLILTRRCPQCASIMVSLTTSSLQLGGAVGAALGGLVVSGPGVASLPLLGVVCAPAAFLLLRWATGQMAGPSR